MIQVYYITKTLIYQRFSLRYQTIFFVMILVRDQEAMGSNPVTPTI